MRNSLFIALAAASVVSACFLIATVGIGQGRNVLACQAIGGALVRSVGGESVCVKPLKVPE